MRTFHFYDPATGLFTGDSLTLSGNKLDVLKQNTPEGLSAYEGNADYLSQRVDAETGGLVDYQPPKPDDDHEWDEQSRRWQKKEEAVNREARLAEAKAERASLEALQIRSISELFANPDDSEARLHFERRKARLDELRLVIAETETSGRAG